MLLGMTKITIHVEPSATDMHFEVREAIEAEARSIERAELPVIEV